VASGLSVRKNKIPAYANLFAWSVQPYSNIDFTGKAENYKNVLIGKNIC